MTEVAKKSCFIITPIGDNNSDIRRKADGVIQSAIRPVLEKNGYNDIKAAHEITTIGSINNQVVSRIVNDDLVIANLSGLNPNVMYELAIRHATMKPLIHICEYGTPLPFDIKDQRMIPYTNDMLGTKELIENLEKLLESIDLSLTYPDNPIYNGIGVSKILQDTSTDDPIKYLVAKVDSLEEKIERNSYLNYIIDKKNPTSEIAKNSKIISSCYMPDTIKAASLIYDNPNLLAAVQKNMKVINNKNSSDD